MRKFKTLISTFFSLYLLTASVSFGYEGKNDQVNTTNVAGYAPNYGFYVQSPDQRFRLVTAGYIQNTFQTLFVENGPDTDSFQVLRARLKWFGYIFNPNIAYQFGYDLVGTQLLDAYIQFSATEFFKVRSGQYKVPFNLEGLSSASTLQFTDRSIAHTFFGVVGERDIGLGFNGHFGEKLLEYHVSIFNGEGANTLNSNKELLYAGRLTLNLLGEHGLEFADPARSEKPHMALGVAGMFNDTPNVTLGGEKQVLSSTFDLSAKFKGFSAHAAYFYRKTDPDSGGSLMDHGALGQAGYFILPHDLEVALRTAHIFAESASDQAEYTIDITYYILGDHRVKFQFGHSALITQDGVSPGDDQINFRTRFQLQVAL